jgi:glycerol-3-phosphate acyltransferase PlsY
VHVYALVLVLAYLLGSIPTGYLVARARGVDIRSVGSGNIGATNVLRVLGKPAGILVLLIDALKGWTAVRLMAPWCVERFLPSAGMEAKESAALIAAVAAVLGHNYTCWLRFKGGKGIATSAGVLTALVPWALLIILSVWVVLFLVTRYVSVGSVAASFTLPFATWFTTHSLTVTFVTGGMGALAVYKHRANIQRLLAGTEPRFGRKTPEAAK